MRCVNTRGVLQSSACSLPSSATQPGRVRARRLGLSLRTGDFNHCKVLIANASDPICYQKGWSYWVISPKFKAVGRQAQILGYKDKASRQDDPPYTGVCALWNQHSLILSASTTARETWLNYNQELKKIYGSQGMPRLCEWLGGDTGFASVSVRSP